MTTKQVADQLRARQLLFYIGPDCALSDEQETKLRNALATLKDDHMILAYTRNPNGTHADVRLPRLIFLSLFVSGVALTACRKLQVFRLAKA